MNSPLTTHSKVDQIFSLEDALLSMPQADLETLHHFAPGVYVREMRVPAGVCVTGAVHKTEHLMICTKGRMKVVNSFGDEQVMQAGDIVLSKPGVKRAGVALEDTYVVTVHVTKETNVEKLEAELVHNDRRLIDREQLDLLEEIA